MATLTAVAVLLLAFSASAKHIRPPHNVEIFGGKTVSIEEAPFMAQYFTPEVFCGGCIISEKFIITAAHCYYGFRDYGLVAEVTVGSDIQGVGKKPAIAEVHPHPNYDPFTAEYDIAVIELAEPLVFDSRVKSIAMAGDDLVLEEGVKLEAVGFGATESDGKSKQLLKVLLPYVPNDKCNATFQHVQAKRNITDKMLCAGGEAGKDTCQGDSGGPLVYKDVVVGLTSFGGNYECASKGVPGAYARVSALRAFVESIMQSNE